MKLLALLPIIRKESILKMKVSSELRLEIIEEAAYDEAIAASPTVWLIREKANSFFSDRMVILMLPLIDKILFAMAPRYS